MNRFPTGGLALGRTRILTPEAAGLKPGGAPSSPRRTGTPRRTPDISF